MWFIGVEVEQETSAPPPKKNPGSAPAKWYNYCNSLLQNFEYLQGIDCQRDSMVF